jgi:hypothetical protein
METLINFNEYQVFYYSQSSNPWEAAYINCFQNDDPKNVVQTGVIIFTYPEGTTLPGQENPVPGSFPPTQVNKLEKRDGKDFFTIYYDISRFDDVINLLRYCVDGKQSMWVSANATNHVWALRNNLHVPLGAQYHV